MLKIGHRGAKGHAPENTMASFLKAFALQADGIELDVHSTADSAVVVLHDATVDRTFPNATGSVNSFTLQQCQSLGMPSLAEVLTIIPPDKICNIEIKDAKATNAVISLLEDYIENHNREYASIIISSFDWTILKQIHDIQPQFLLGVLTEDSIEEAVRFATSIQAYSIHPYYKLLTSTRVSLIKENGFKIHTWTVNLSEDITFVKNLGVDAIISDYPDWL